MPNRDLGNGGLARFTTWGHALTLVLSQTLFIVGPCALLHSHLIHRKVGYFCSTYHKVQEGVGPVEWLESKAKASGPHPWIWGQGLPKDPWEGAEDQVK